MGACGDGEDQESNLWWLGVMMSIIASILSNLGVNIQKFSMMKEQVREEGKRRGYWCQPYYFTGFLMIVFGSLGDFAALGFAAQSLITPVGGVTMVANVFFAHFWLKETLSKRDLLGTAGVIIGILLIAIFADKKESCYTLPELIDLYEETVFLVYAAFVVITAALLYGFVKYCEHLYKTPGKWHRYLKVKKYHQFIYPTLSGVLGSQSVLFAKSTAELLKSTFDGDNQMIYVVTYVILAGMFCCILFQLHFLAMGLKWFDAVYIIPVFQCFFITVTILGGAVYFKEFSGFSAVQGVFFGLGVVITLTGIVFLSKRRMAEHGHPSMKGVGLAILFYVRIQRLKEGRDNSLFKLDLESRRSHKRAVSQRLEDVKKLQEEEGRADDGTKDWRAGVRKWPLRQASRRAVDANPPKKPSKMARLCPKLRKHRSRSEDHRVLPTGPSVGNDPEAVSLARRRSSAAEYESGGGIELTVAPAKGNDFTDVGAAADDGAESKGMPRRSSRAPSGEVAELSPALPGDVRGPQVRAVVQSDSGEALTSHHAEGSVEPLKSIRVPKGEGRDGGDTIPLTHQDSNGSSGDSPAKEEDTVSPSGLATTRSAGAVVASHSNGSNRGLSRHSANDVTVAVSSQANGGTPASAPGRPPSFPPVNTSQGRALVSSVTLASPSHQSSKGKDQDFLQDSNCVPHLSKGESLLCLPFSGSGA